MVPIILRTEVAEPVPKSRGNVWMPTSPTGKPRSMDFNVNSAPMKGLSDFNSIPSSTSRLMSLMPVDISRNGLLKTRRSTAL